MADQLAAFWNDLNAGARSLRRAKGLTAAVIVTLALGIGANAAMFSLVRGVLLRPLVNRDESKLIFIEQTSNRGDVAFSVPEVQDLETRVKTLTSFGDFSEMEFTLVGLGEPRTVRSGVVNGTYFGTMGLRPVLGRLLDQRDDGPKAAGAAVLTYRFWSTALNKDPNVIGKTIRLGSFIDTREATVVGVLEPCVPYPQDTEIIANIVTSAHHLSATMVTGRIHRMTELFARLTPGTSMEQARAELAAVYGGIKSEHPEAYPKEEGFGIRARRLRDELTSGARTILLVLMAASVLVFVIACSNVANLILARTVRREGELGIRAALGARAMDLRRVLLAESLMLCGAGAVIGVAIAGPLTAVLARYASRYSVRALDLSVDSSALAVGAGLAILAAVVLAFVPRLPLTDAARAFGLSSGGPRVTGTANRRLKVFALVQIAASFVLVASAAATVTTLVSLESAQTGFDVTHVLAVNVPVMREGTTTEQRAAYAREAARQIRQLPGVANVAWGLSVPWRDRDVIALQFEADGKALDAGQAPPRASFQVVSPGFFATLGLPVLEGRDFADSDRAGGEPVAIISETLARKMFQGRSALNHRVAYSDPLLQFLPGFQPLQTRIIGIVPDIDNSHIPARPLMTIYHPSDQEQFLLPGRLLIETRTDPYALTQPVARIIRKLSANQPVEKASTLADIRAEVLSPEKLNAVVFGVFGGVALLIAVVGVAGVLAFSVSVRTREFGIRLAVGSAPRDLLMRVIGDGAAMAIGGLALGFVSGYWLAQGAGKLLGDLKLPGVWPVTGAALVLLAAAVIASAIPAMRAARVDVMQALRNE